MTAAVRFAAWVAGGLVFGTAAGLTLDHLAGTTWPRTTAGLAAVTVGAVALIRTGRTQP